MTERLTYTVPEAAGMLGVSARHLYELVAAGDVRAVRLGRRVLIPRHVVAELVA
jgi:excisionase family DNA binding protein